jgi:hypothetical protein
LLVSVAKGAEKLLQNCHAQEPNVLATVPSLTDSQPGLNDTLYEPFDFWNDASFEYFLAGDFDFSNV